MQREIAFRWRQIDDQSKALYRVVRLIYLEISNGERVVPWATRPRTTHHRLNPGEQFKLCDRLHQIDVRTRMEHL